MITFFQKLLSKQPDSITAQLAQRSSDNSPISVWFDDWGIYSALYNKNQAKIAWNEIELVAICIEDPFLPFPYWYVGHKEYFLRIPNDAQGAKELFFDGFSKNIPGYNSDTTYRTIIEASGAIEGSFILWKSADAHN